MCMSSRRSITKGIARAESVCEDFQTDHVWFASTALSTVLPSKISWICQALDKQVGKSAPFQSAGKWQEPRVNGFKQVQIAYLAVIRYLDKLVQPSYALFAQIRPLATPRQRLTLWPPGGSGDYATPVTVNWQWRNVAVVFKGLIDVDVMLLSRSKG